MCACRRCRSLLALGVAAGVVLGHEAPHDHTVAPGERAVWFGKVAIVRGTTGGVTGSAALAVPVAVAGRATVTPPPPVWAKSRRCQMTSTNSRPDRAAKDCPRQRVGGSSRRESRDLARVDRNVKADRGPRAVDQGARPRHGRIHTHHRRAAGRRLFEPASLNPAWHLRGREVAGHAGTQGQPRGPDCRFSYLLVPPRPPACPGSENLKSLGGNPMQVRVLPRA